MIHLADSYSHHDAAARAARMAFSTSASHSAVGIELFASAGVFVMAKGKQGGACAATENTPAQTGVSLAGGEA